MEQFFVQLATTAIGVLACAFAWAILQNAQAGLSWQFAAVFAVAWITGRICENVGF